MTSNSLWSQCVVPDPADRALPCGSSLLRLLDSHQLQPVCLSVGVMTIQSLRCEDPTPSHLCSHPLCTQRPQGGGRRAGEGSEVRLSARRASATAEKVQQQC